MRRAPFLGFLATIGACGSAPAPNPTATPLAAGAFALKQDWESVVIADREDSVVLTLPTGAHQLHHFRRIAGFTAEFRTDGDVTIRLDSVKTIPVNADEVIPAGTRWTGRVGDVAVGAFRPEHGTSDLTSMVRELLPRLPAAGARARSTWVDSATGTTYTDIFKVSERRTATWVSGIADGAGPSMTLPIRLTEEFEQVGDGEQDDRRMTITSQGRRSGTYYVTASGKIRQAEVTDSSAISIGVPDTKQVMSGTRVTRTTIRFIPVRGEP